MEDYTINDIVKELNIINPTNRKRALVDQRSYLIGILAYKFNLTEHAIAKLISQKRDKINYNKKLALEWFNDRLYQKNVYVHAQMYPFDFTNVKNEYRGIKSNRTYRQKEVILVIDFKLYNKLQKTKELLEHTDIRITIKHLLEKSLKLWEK